MWLPYAPIETGIVCGFRWPLKQIDKANKHLPGPRLLFTNLPSAYRNDYRVANIKSTE